MKLNKINKLFRRILCGECRSKPHLSKEQVLELDEYRKELKKKWQGL